MSRIIALIAVLLVLFQGLWSGPVILRALAGQRLEAVYPYSMERRKIEKVTGRSTLPVFIDLTSYDVPRVQPVRITIRLPKGFRALPKDGWIVKGKTAVFSSSLEPYYGRVFDLLYLQAGEEAVSGGRELMVTAEADGWKEEKRISFFYDAAAPEAEPRPFSSGQPDNKKFNWYIQSVILPVDNQGRREERAEPGVIYVRDMTLESFRNRMAGEGSTSWAAVFNHPATYLLLDLRNPQQDIRVLKFKAQLLDRATGKAAEGLITAGKTDHQHGEGWAGDTGDEAGTTALISLDGKKSQSFILPLYMDYFKILEGNYTLRVTVSGGGQEKIQETPLTIAKKHSLGLLAVGVSGVCFLILLFLTLRLKKCLKSIGAKGAITVSLFAAISFGGIVLPSTVLGDLIHALLGPFSSLVTGLWSGVMQYLLIMALLMLYPRPGVLMLLYLIKFLLSGVMFGHFSPLGILSLSVCVVVLEFLLYVSGFYRQLQPGKGYMLGLALLLGVGDALISFINLEQMMFFYRLYYADWFLAMYMLVNGVLYSSIGCWLGYGTGMKLRQVVGE